MSTAWEITIAETLHLLDGAFEEFARGVADDAYAVWLGAGISLGKLPGLTGVVESVLEHLRSTIDATNADCPFKRSLDRIIGLVSLNATDRNGIDYIVPVAKWPLKEHICETLTGQYARVAAD